MDHKFAPLSTPDDYIDDLFQSISIALFIMYIAILVIIHHDRQKSLNKLTLVPYYLIIFTEFFAAVVSAIGINYLSTDVGSYERRDLILVKFVQSVRRVLLSILVLLQCHQWELITLLIRF